MFTKQRYLEPSLVCPLGDYFLAVDHTHPAAALLSPKNETVSVVTWKNLVRQPTTRKVWPYRSLFSNREGAVWLTEHSTKETIQVSINTGEVSLRRAEEPTRDEYMEIHRSRYIREGKFSTGHGVHATIHVDVRGFVCFSYLYINTSDAPHAVNTIPLGKGAIVDFASSKNGLAACLRETDKRPWQFAPSYKLLMSAMEDTGAPTTVQPINITDACWPFNSSVHTEPELAEHMPYVLSECEALSRAGMKDIDVSILDISAIPRVETTFRDPRGEEWYARLDCPFDEIGTPTGGLSQLAIFFEEDINSGLLQTIKDSRPQSYHDTGKFWV